MCSRPSSGCRGSVPAWYERLQYFDRLIADLGRLPGVRSVAGATTVPLTGDLGSGSMWRTDAPGAYGRRPPTSAADQWRAAILIATPRYFETMRIPVLRGRAFTDADRFTQEQFANTDGPRPPGVAIVNEAMAKRFWPNANPLGTTIFVFDDQTFASYRTIVGVVGDVRAESVDSAALADRVSAVRAEFGSAAVADAAIEPAAGGAGGPGDGPAACARSRDQHLAACGRSSRCSVVRSRVRGSRCCWSAASRRSRS